MISPASSGVNSRTAFAILGAGSFVALVDSTILGVFLHVIFSNQDRNYLDPNPLPYYSVAAIFGGLIGYAGGMVIEKVGFVANTSFSLIGLGFKKALPWVS